MPTSTDGYFSFEIIRPPHFAVCNAVGAALCAVSGTVESIVDLLPSTVDGGEQRKQELNRLTIAVQQQCERNGADPATIRLVDIEQVPLAYYPGGNKHRVLLIAVGELDLSKLRRSEQRTDEPFSLTEISTKSSPDARPPIYLDMSNKRPFFDDKGVWILDAIDIEHIAYGAAILGEWCFPEKKSIRNDRSW